MNYTPQIFWDNFDKTLKEKKLKLTDIFDYQSKDYSRMSIAKHDNRYLRLDDILMLCEKLQVSVERLLYGVEQTTDNDLKEVIKAYKKDKYSLITVARLINKLPD